MSYDLNVYSQKSLTGDELQKLIADSKLGVEGGGGAGILSVLRGAKAKHCFTLEGPKPIEEEDVPEEITAVLLGASVLYEILVEGSSEPDIPHAVRFARRLAKASDGAVLNPQEDSVWSRGKQRAAPRVERGLVDIVEFRWYLGLEVTGRGLAQVWLDLAQKLLPEALPRRFGTYEPFPKRLDRDGPEAFLEMVGEAGHMFFTAALPCTSGFISIPTWKGPRVFKHISLSVLRTPLEDRRWREALRRFFVQYALEIDCLFATAEVDRGWEWTGQSLRTGRRIDTPIILGGSSTWVGLLPYPAWWAWFGRDYAPLVSGHLATERREAFDPGLLHAFPGEPQDREQLALILAGESQGEPSTRRRKERKANREDSDSLPWYPGWLPAELLPTVDHVKLEKERQKYPWATERVPPLKPASVIPSGLLPKD